MAFLSLSDNLLPDTNIIVHETVNNFEIAHKTYLTLVGWSSHLSSIKPQNLGALSVFVKEMCYSNAWSQK